MAKRKQADINFAFFEHLWTFYLQNRSRVRQHYRALSRKFLAHNDPENANAYLRRPQFEALEMYIFLKEYMDNAPIADLFQHWARRTGKFENRAKATIHQGTQLSLLEELTKDQFDAVYAQMRAGRRDYPNYIFALTMGTGKTILMATCIFYEFLLANKYPADARYCHNALVFAPDKTVLESLREIITMRKDLVVPPAYVNWLETNIRVHFLDDAGTTLDTLDRSRFNLIISNTQKIILKRQAAEKTPLEKLLNSGKPTYQRDSVYAAYADLYDLDEPESEADLTTNQRFEKLRRLEQLGIYIDEAHHAFGTNLARDVGAVPDTRTTSLRVTIDELAASLQARNTHVVACYNYTGTPYVGSTILPEVVYAFSLNDAIRNAYLKKVRIDAYTNPRSAEFIRLVVDDFLAHNDLDDRHEGLRPKLAFFAATIKELQHELRPAVEAALAAHAIPTSRILVNVGDEKLTTDDDIREFNRLDTPASDKQFILLVNKGREGWNCRSLFGVALFRKPKSKIFVLQATMRCLRSIGDAQQTGLVYLSEENKQILDDELQQNFRTTVEEITATNRDRETVKVRVNEPVETIKLKRVRRMYRAREKHLAPGTVLDLDRADRDRYRITRVTQEGLVADGRTTTTEDITHIRDQRRFTRLTLVAEIARYLNKPCLEVEPILDATAEGVDGILTAVNEFNDLLYDYVIPRLFQELFDIQEYTADEAYEVSLVKLPEAGYYEVTGIKDLTVRQTQERPELRAKSFHLDTYCFDSKPEHALFWSLLRDRRIQKLYFTGMLTHGQSDFYVQYVDPESRAVRSYYPDFLARLEDGSYLIIEVKGDNKIDDPVVLAKKQYAEETAVASGMRYEIIRGTDALAGHYHHLLQ